MQTQRKFILPVYKNGEQTLEVLFYPRLLVSSTTASTSLIILIVKIVAEREGFEPSGPF